DWLPEPNAAGSRHRDELEPCLALLGSLWGARRTMTSRAPRPNLPGMSRSNKSERHHWWPECLSKHWADPDGGVHWLRPDGSEQRAKPAAFGVIGNGHFIKLGREAGETTAWDQNFE